MREAALAILASAFSWNVAVSQEVPPMPSPEVLDAYIAWDEGRYPEALESYLSVLRGAEAVERVEEIARLTGELHPVRQIDDDGRGVQISPDGRYVRWIRGLGPEAVTRVGPAWRTFRRPRRSRHRAPCRALAPSGWRSRPKSPLSRRRVKSPT
jgi:hypothetical protein